MEARRETEVRWSPDCRKWWSFRTLVVLRRWRRGPLLMVSLRVSWKKRLWHHWYPRGGIQGHRANKRPFRVRERGGAVDSAHPSPPKFSSWHSATGVCHPAAQGMADQSGNIALSIAPLLGPDVLGSPTMPRATRSAASAPSAASWRSRAVSRWSI